MDKMRGLRSAASVRERRLAALLAAGGREVEDPELQAVVDDTQLLGSLELAGLHCTWSDVRRSRTTGAGPAAILSHRRARAAVERNAPLTLAAIRSWHQALAGPVGFRKEPRARDGAPTAPPELIESRMALLETWLAARSGRDLRPEQAGALTMARIVEVLPFDDANGRVARLAASHVMVAGGRRPPILVAADAPRLVSALQSAFRLETEQLSILLEEASDRALDVMIQALEKGEV
jgi:Fic family protein